MAKHKKDVEREFSMLPEILRDQPDSVQRRAIELGFHGMFATPHTAKELNAFFQSAAKALDAPALMVATQMAINLMAIERAKAEHEADQEREAAKLSPAQGINLRAAIQSAFAAGPERKELVAWVRSMTRKPVDVHSTLPAPKGSSSHG